LDRQLQQLEQQLRDLLSEHDALLALIRRKREALRQAKPSVVSACCQSENGHVQKIGEIEKARQQLAAIITRQIDPDATCPMALREIAEQVDEPQRGRLLVLHQQLKERMEQVRRESAVTRRAMEGLLNHVQGIVQSLTQYVGGGGTYGRRGVVTCAPAGASSFSLTG
jgi:hypothetical protein